MVLFKNNSIKKVTNKYKSLLYKPGGPPGGPGGPAAPAGPAGPKVIKFFSNC